MNVNKTAKMGKCKERGIILFNYKSGKKSYKGLDIFSIESSVMKLHLTSYSNPSRKSEFRVFHYVNGQTVCSICFSEMCIRCTVISIVLHIYLHTSTGSMPLLVE